jgi:hypothetical protein
MAKQTTAQKAKARKATGKEATSDEGRNEQLVKLGSARATLSRLIEADADDAVTKRQRMLITGMEDQLGMEPGEEIKLNGDSNTAAAEVEDPDDNETGGTTKAGKPKAARKPAAKKERSPYCLCGCGASNNPGSLFNMGHDAKLKSQLRKIERGLMKVKDLEDISQGAVKKFNLFPNWMADKADRLAADKAKKVTAK